MALNKQELIDEALAIIPREECVTLEEVWLFMGITRTTAFNYQLNVVDEIKEAVLQEKIKVKKKLRRKWRDSDNATLQIAEFKLCSDDEELARLNTQKVNADVNVTGKGRVIMELPEDDGAGS
jgi:hypothetical protein